MKVHHILICFFFFTLQTGNIGVLAGRRVQMGFEGGSITVACSFMFARDRRFFCKQECVEDVLIETTGDKAENGRYKVEYSKTTYLSYPVLYVTIKRLSKSDAGRYRCGLGKPLLPDSQEDFELIVRDAPIISKPSYTSRPFSTPASTPMMTQSLSSSSGSLTSSSASPEITEQTEKGTAPLGSVPNTSKPNWTLQTFPTSASTPTTTQRLSSSSVSFTSSSASPETTEQPEQQQTERATAPLGSAPTTSKPNWTLQAFPTSASTPTTTQHLSSVSFTSSSSSPETTEQSEQQRTERATARLSSAPNTSKPNWTLQAFPTSASTPTTTQHLSSSSVSFTSSSSPETTEQSEQQQRTERATARLGSWNLLYVGFALLIMMAVLLVFGLLFRVTRRKERLMKAEYTQGRYIEQNGDNNRATAAGSQNQATEDLSTTTLLHSAPTGNSSDVNYSVL